MKRLLSVMLSMVLLLPMTACEKTHEITPPVKEDPGPPPPAYTLTFERTADKYSDTDGTLLASYDYEIVKMQTSDPASAEMQGKADAFNSMMDALLENQLGDELREWAVYDERIQDGGQSYFDELEAAYTEVGDYISVVYTSDSYTGGAHGSHYSFSYLFDMERGAYVDPAEIADDPELLRATVTDLILDQINGMDEEERLALFEDYPSVVAQWNDYCVALEEDRMQVTFSAYDIGPYAMGAVSFDIPYTAIKDALGEGGTAKLLTEAN